MKTIKILLSFMLITTLFTSCYRETVIIEPPIQEVPLSINQLLNSYELWYVDINATLGYGETPFYKKHLQSHF